MYIVVFLYSIPPSKLDKEKLVLKTFRPNSKHDKSSRENNYFFQMESKPKTIEPY